MTLLILTPTLGANPLLRETVASIAAAAPGARHVIVTPASAVAAVKKLAPGAHIVVEGEAGAASAADGPSGAVGAVGGIYAALNAGVRAMADAEWDAVTWINDDDRLCAPGFGLLLADLGGNSAGTGKAEDRTAREVGGRAGVAYGKVAMIDGRGARIGGLPVARCGDDLAALLARGIVPLAQPGTVITRAAWEKVGGLDASYRLAGDLDFFVRALAAGVGFKFVDADVAEFRLSAGQLSKQQAAGEREKARALAGLAAGTKGARARPRAGVGALWRFRGQNLGLYAERVRRHGFVSMQQLYTRTT